MGNFLQFEVEFMFAGNVRLPHTAITTTQSAHGPFRSFRFALIIVIGVPELGA
jgi:hypothetical protein